MICTRSSKSQGRNYAMRGNILKDALTPKPRKRNLDSPSMKDVDFKRYKSSKPSAAEKVNSKDIDIPDSSNSTRMTMITRSSRKRITNETSAPNGKLFKPSVGKSVIVRSRGDFESSENETKRNKNSEIKEEITASALSERCLVNSNEKIDVSTTVKLGRKPYSAVPFSSKQYLEDLSRRSSKLMLLQEIIMNSDHLVSRPEIFAREINTKDFFSRSATVELYSFLTCDAEFFGYQKLELQLSSVGLVRKSYAEAFERRLSSFKAAANEGGISGRTRRRRRARLIEALAACQSPTFQPDDEDTDPCSLTDDEEEATAAVEEKDDDEEEEEEKEKEEVKEEEMMEDKREGGSRPWRSRRANGKQLLQWKFCYEVTASKANAGRTAKSRPRKEEKKEPKEEKGKEEKAKVKKVKDTKDTKCSRLTPSSFSVNLPPGSSVKPAAAIKRRAADPNNLIDSLRETLSQIVSKDVEMELSDHSVEAHLSNVSTEELHGLLVATVETPFVVQKVTKQEVSKTFDLRYVVIVGLREEKLDSPDKMKKVGESRKQVTQKETYNERRKKAEMQEETRRKYKKEEKRPFEKERGKKKTKEDLNNKTEKERKEMETGRIKMTDKEEERKKEKEAEIKRKSSEYVRDKQDEKEPMKECTQDEETSPALKSPLECNTPSLPESSPDPAMKTTPGRFLVKAMCFPSRPSRLSIYSDSSDEEVETRLDPDVQERMEEMQQPIKSVVNSKGLRDAQRRIRHRKTDPDIHPVTRLYNSRLKACRKKETGAAAVAKILKRAVLNDRRIAPRLPLMAVSEARPVARTSCASIPPPKVQVDNRGRFVDPFRRDQHTPATALTASERLKLLKSNGSNAAREDSPPRSLGVVIEEVREGSSEGSPNPSIQDAADIIPKSSSGNMEIEDPAEMSLVDPKCELSSIVPRSQRPLNASIRVVTQPMQTFTNSPIRVVRPSTMGSRSVKMMNQNRSPNVRPPTSVEVINLSSSPTLSSSSSFQMQSPSSVKVVQSSSPVKIPQSSTSVGVTQSSFPVKVTLSSASVKVVAQPSGPINVVNQSSNRVNLIGRSLNIVKKTPSSSSPIKLLSQSSSRVKVIGQPSSSTKNTSQLSRDTDKLFDRVKLIGQSSNRIKVVSQPSSSSAKIAIQSNISSIENIDQSKPNVVKVINQGQTNSTQIIKQPKSSPIKMVNKSPSPGSVKVINSSTSPVKLLSQSCDPAKGISPSTSSVKVISQPSVSPVKVISKSLQSSESQIQNVNTSAAGLTVSFATPPRVSHAVSVIAGHNVSNSMDALCLPAVQVPSSVGVGVAPLPGAACSLMSATHPAAAVPSALSARPLVRDKSAGFRRILPRPQGEHAASNAEARQINATQRRASDTEEAKPNALPERQVSRLKSGVQQNTSPKAVKNGSGSPKITAVNSVDSLRVPPASSYAAVPPNPKCNTEYAPSAIRISMTRVKRLEDDERSNESAKDS